MFDIFRVIIIFIVAGAIEMFLGSRKSKWLGIIPVIPPLGLSIYFGRVYFGTDKSNLSPEISYALDIVLSGAVISAVLTLTLITIYCICRKKIKAKNENLNSGTDTVE